MCFTPYISLCLFYLCISPSVYISPSVSFHVSFHISHLRSYSICILLSICVSSILPMYPTPYVLSHLSSLMSYSIYIPTCAYLSLYISHFPLYMCIPLCLCVPLCTYIPLRMCHIPYISHFVRVYPIFLSICISFFVYLSNFVWIPFQVYPTFHSVCISHFVYISHFVCVPLCVYHTSISQPYISLLYPTPVSHSMFPSIYIPLCICKSRSTSQLLVAY